MSDHMTPEALLARRKEYPGPTLPHLYERPMNFVRGMGLMIGVELVKDPKTKEPALAEAKQVMEVMKDDGGTLLGSSKRGLEVASKQAAAV